MSVTPPRARIERRLTVMGTGLSLTVEAQDRAAALRASECAVRALEASEAMLSTWGETSELARLNRAPVSMPVRLSSELAADLRAAFDCAERTAGCFDPALGPLVRAWGLRAGGRAPSTIELARARASSGREGFELRGDMAVRRKAGAAIEEGGFGKGAGLDRALAAARAAGAMRAEIDLGGQLAWFDQDTTARMTVELADPRNRESALVSTVIPAGSIATSGNSERGIVVKGRRMGHILDPLSGSPAIDFGSVSVWSRSALDADCLSTALDVMGPEAALAWAARNDDIEVVVMESVSSGIELGVRASAGLRGHLAALDSRAVFAPELPSDAFNYGRPRCRAAQEQ